MALATDKCTVDFAMPDGKESRAQKELKDLKKKQPRVHADFELRFQALARGQLLPKEKYRELQGKDTGIFEIKAPHPPYRLFGFRKGNFYYLTHITLKTP